MPTYQIETENGQVYEIESDVQVDDPKALGDMLGEELRVQRLREAEELRRAMPVGQRLLEAARGMLGGVRDAGQAILDTPADVLNTVTEFVSPDPPGGPGPRRRVVPEVQGPQLPDPTGPAETGLEKGVWLGTSIGTTLAISLLSPAVRAKLAPPLRRTLGEVVDVMLGARRPIPGAVRTPPPAPRLYEPGAVAATRAEIEAAQAARQAAQSAREAKAMAALLESRPSEAARNISRRLLDFHIDDLGKMNQTQIENARKRLFSRLPDIDLEAERGTIAEILMRLEGHIHTLSSG